MLIKNIMKCPVLKAKLDDGRTIELEQTSSDIWNGEGLELRLQTASVPRQTVVKPVLRVNGNVPGIISIELFSSLLPDSAFRLLRFGFNMPGDPVLFCRVDRNGFAAPLKDTDKSFIAENAEECRISSNSLFCFKAENAAEITLLGSASFDKSEGTIELHLDKKNGEFRLAYKQILDGVVPVPGQEFPLDSFVLMTGADLNSMLRQWAELTAEKRGALIPESIPTGWNDWQYYRNEKTACDVLDSAEVLAEMKRDGYPLEFVQVDGGFCMHLSEWTHPKPEFASGIGALSERIRNMGLKFGLWFAPYIQNVNTSVVKEHPEWLLKDKSGQTVVLDTSNVGQSCLIDYTVSGTGEWLRKQVRLFVDEWQVEWIKLDGPNYAVYRRGRLHDRSMTISEMLNRTFEIIREEADLGVLIEGEGMMGLALGKVELHRVQTDNHCKWYENNKSGSEYAPRVYGKELIMSFLHNRWWCNHRENVILRNSPSELSYAGIDNPGAVEQMFTEPEFRTQLTAAVMGSGGLLLTDPLQELRRDQERFAWISKLLPVYSQAAEIVDAFPPGRYPSIYKIEVKKNRLIYSFTNWTDIICDLECDLPPEMQFHAFSVFEKRAFGIHGGKLKISGLTAHDSRIITLVKRTNAPLLLATDLHLLPGTVEVRNCNYTGGVLDFEICHFKQNDNRIYLAADGYEIVDIESDAVCITVDDFNPEYPVIRFHGNPGHTCFRIKWSK